MGNVAQTVERAHNQIDRTIRERRYLKLLMVGGHKSGKTSILQKIREGKEGPPSCSTDSFNVESISHEGLQFVVWEVVGDSMYRLLWRRFCPSTKVIVYVVDSTSFDNDDEDEDEEEESILDYTREELESILEEDCLEGVPLLLLCNKQDAKDARKPLEIVESLGLVEMMDDRPWTAVGCSAMDGMGLQEGLHWIEQVLRHPKRSSSLSPTKKQHEATLDESMSTISTAMDSTLSEDSFTSVEEPQCTR